MKGIRRLVSAAVAATILALPLATQAVEMQAKVESSVVMVVGSKVHLFHSGTADVKKEICLNDVLSVHRELMAGGHTTSQEVGKVKVLAYVGEHYFEAEILEGKIMSGDIAKKKTAFCLIQPKP